MAKTIAESSKGLRQKLQAQLEVLQQELAAAQGDWRKEDAVKAKIIQVRMQIASLAGQLD